MDGNQDSTLRTVDFKTEREKVVKNLVDRFVNWTTSRKQQVAEPDVPHTRIIEHFDDGKFPTTKTQFYDSNLFFDSGFLKF